MGDERRETIFVHLGELTCNFNILRGELSSLIWMLIGPDPQIGIRVTARMNMNNLLALAERLFKYRIEDAQPLAAFKELLQEVSLANKKRNKYIHSVWEMELGAPAGSITRIEYTSKINRFVAEEMPQQAISEDVAFVGLVSYKFFMFNAKLMGIGYFPDYSDKFFHMFDTELDEEE